MAAFNDDQNMHAPEDGGLLGGNAGRQQNRNNRRQRAPTSDNENSDGDENTHDVPIDFQVPAQFKFLEEKKRCRTSKSCARSSRT